MNICVVGTGYVGLIAGTCLADFGNKVICVDIDADKVENLQKGLPPICEPGLSDLIKHNVEKGRLFFSTDLRGAVANSVVIFIAVGTPVNHDGTADLSQVYAVAEDIGSYMDGYKVIVNKSTVPVGTGRKIAEIIRKSQKRAVNFSLVSNPEFLREGCAVQDFVHPDRIVIGCSDMRAVTIMKAIYRPLHRLGTPIICTNIESAEMIKYASNAFLAMKISFINEVANLCEKVEADVNVVAEGMGLDKRIGPDFLHAGPGYGGSCLPKDTKAFGEMAKEAGCELKLVDAVVEVNERQKLLMVQKIKDVVGNLKGKTIGILGLSFKPNTDDMREAPSLAIVPRLKEEAAKIKAYDPVAMQKARAIFDGVQYCENAYEVCQGSDALVILTEWDEFRDLDLKEVKNRLKVPIIVDTRNVYDPEKMRGLGFNYVGVGRGDRKDYRKEQVELREFITGKELKKASPCL